MAETHRTEEAKSRWLVCPEVRKALPRLEDTLEAVVDTKQNELREIAIYLIRRGGKRLRPALLLTAARFGGSSDEDRLLRAAAAIELIHVASLYHDDVMDRASTRRGGTSANGRWGNEMAAVAGTYLFARGCALLASLGDGANQLASRASADLCTGQMLEMENAFNLALSEEEHRSILRRKTATLFALPCRLGALLGGAPAAVRRALARYGTHLGGAFQLADDALDLRGDASRMGKATGTDLREGIYSLAVLRALRRERKAPSRERPLEDLLRRARLGRADVEAVRRRVIASGAVEEALGEARAGAEQAHRALGDLDDGVAKRSLERLAVYAVERSS